MYKQNLALNNPQELICHKTQQKNQVSGTIPSILANLNNAVFFPSLWRPFWLHQLQLVSLSPSYSIVFSARSKYLFDISFCFIFTLLSAGTVRFIRWQILFFLFTLGLVFWMGLSDLFVSQNLWEFYGSHFQTNTGLFLYHLSIGSYFNLLHSSQWITFPTLSYLVLYSFIPVFCIHLLCN